MPGFLSLRTKTTSLVALMVAVTLACGGVMIWNTYRVDRLIQGMVSDTVAAYQAAEALETALVNQKGFMSYYVMDRNPEWLQRLGEYRQLFRMRLERAQGFAGTAEERETLATIGEAYDLYVTAKDKALGLYISGDEKAGGEAHAGVRAQFFQILTHCEAYKKAHAEELFETRQAVHARARQLRWVTMVALLCVTFLGGSLTLLLGRQVLAPLRRLAREEAGELSLMEPNEVKAVTHRIENLIRSAGEAHTELARSRENLLMAEKMVLVGKLAAGMAHSIRNPMTSVKMRLFSLNRSLPLTREQEEDFQVITREIGQVDTIVQNFLEFSRPPRLAMQLESPSTVVDRVLQLLSHRLRSYEVAVEVKRERALPEVTCDPEQLKEAFVNFMENACKAMGGGGRIVISERVVSETDGAGLAEISFADTGCGIPEEELEQVFQPFFTTREDGTGLGLPISQRIIENHGGWIDVDSVAAKGTTFVVYLPMDSEEKK
ncbi:ATP-binding protein [Desulfoluna spongiiphila]|uniref:ATP-binding protein n=1 Tax=Desulfoluna spongiiphila TaxID=419481 RepID=UPI0012554C9D|nr:ATP-binding protein [Desulfoluna spongiiphila]VVS93356.1 histidine kinase domain [Desulfoluna spongiiphila]